MKILIEVKDQDLQREIFEYIKWQPTWFDMAWIMWYYDRSERTIHRWVNSGKIQKKEWLYYINRKKD